MKRASSMGPNVKVESGKLRSSAVTPLHHSTFLAPGIFTSRFEVPMQYHHCVSCRKPLFSVNACFFLLLFLGCRPSHHERALVLTQLPLAAATLDSAATILDQRYPLGSRVVVSEVSIRSSKVRIISIGLAAAGNPVVSRDGQRIVFSGKAGAAAAWQIYEAQVGGGRPRQLTRAEGGAFDPALLPDGAVVFCSPVPKAGDTRAPAQPATLYVQGVHERPARRLSFGSSSVSSPVVLADGRILFVSALPGATNLALFTINNDGTEVTHFACQQDGASFIARPRELSDGRIAFLGSETVIGGGALTELVRSARPFSSRAPLLSSALGLCRSVEPADNGQLLAALDAPSGSGSRNTSCAIYQIDPTAERLAKPLFADPLWNNLEASYLTPRPKAMGHISSMNPAQHTGFLLCLDANRTSVGVAGKGGTAAANRIRLLARDRGKTRSLGEVALQRDGSFLAEVPADIALGFEALDEKGQVLRRLDPGIWVRPGENRACIGCHEAHNRSPRNHRPFAAELPPVSLTGASGLLATQDAASDASAFTAAASRRGKKP